MIRESYIKKRLGGVRFWKAIRARRRSAALHLTLGGRVETGLHTERDEVEITIYSEHDGRMGTASFTIFSEEEFDDALPQAEEIARCISNAPFPLQPSKRVPSVALADEAIVSALKQDPDRLLRSLARTLPKTDSGEIELRHVRTTLFNSEGQRVASERTEFYVEATIVRGGREHLCHERGVRLADWPDFAAAAAIARDHARAQRYSGTTSRILLSGEAIQEFWSPQIGLSPLLFHAGARVKHMGLSRYERGEMVAPAAFSLASNPLIDYNVRSSRCDEDGVPSIVVPVITHGAWDSLYASKRFAHYLGIPATGALGVIEIAPGEAMLAAENGCVEIIALSSFVPNTVSGDFSAEVRLAYLNGDRRRPVHGGLLSGNVFSMLPSVQASRLVVERPGYQGPAAMRFTTGVTYSGFRVR